MANCDDLSIREISGGTVYLQGTITGLDSNKEYCLKYYEGGGIWRNVLNRSYDYTYVPNRTSLNTGSIDCCIPESAYTGAGKYYIAMYEVMSTCENVVGQVCDKYVELVEEPNMCRLDFIVMGMDWNPMSGIVCRVGGKSATTDGAGGCSIEVECGKSYTARCDIPSGYTCDCPGCCCEDGPFTPTGNGAVETFYLEKVTEPAEHCQQDFKVIDQNGDPVEKVILGGEDQSDFSNFDIKGHAGTGTERDGTVSTLQTISGRSYKFYISEFPPGYEPDADGISVVGPLNACTREIVFKVKNLSIVPGACSVNVCVQNQFSENIPGIAIAITDAGIVYTKDKLEMFGCTGEIGLACGRSIKVTATVPDGYKAGEISKTFTSEGKKTIILTIEDLTPDHDKVELIVDLPSIVMAGTTEISGTGPSNERVYIMGEKKWLGFDYLATDTELADTIIDADGTYSTEIELDEFGSVQIYAKVKKGGFWDWIVADLYSKKHTVWVLTWTVVIALLLAVGLILEKKYNKLGIFK